MFLDDDANDVVVGATKEIKTEHPELPSIEVESNQSMAENSIEPQTSPADNLQLQEEEFQGVCVFVCAFECLHLHSIELQISFCERVSSIVCFVCSPPPPGVFKSLRSRSVLYRELCGESLGDRTIDKGDEDIVVVGDQVETIANPADAGPLIMFPYSCGHCHLIFQYLSLLDDHLKVHRASQVAPKSTSTYACNLCAFATDEKGRIKKHVLRKH